MIALLHALMKPVEIISAYANVQSNVRTVDFTLICVRYYSSMAQHLKAESTVDAALRHKHSASCETGVIFISTPSTSVRRSSFNSQTSNGLQFLPRLYKIMSSHLQEICLSGYLSQPHGHNYLWSMMQRPISTICFQPINPPPLLQS